MRATPLFLALQFGIAVEVHHLGTSKALHMSCPWNQSAQHCIRTSRMLPRKHGRQQGQWHHNHRSTLSNWTYQAPHLLVIGYDFAKHVHIKTLPFLFQTSCWHAPSWPTNSLFRIMDWQSSSPNSCRSAQQVHNVPCVQNRHLDILPLREVRQTTTMVQALWA